MARTPLFARLVRACALHRRAIDPRPVDPGRRRLLLGASGAAIALPFIGAQGACSSDRISTRVAIIGGGMAGLHAAYRLKQRGLRATVFEAARRVGGRMYTDRATFVEQDGQHCELGGELIDTPHLTMQDLAGELDIPLLDYTTDDLSLAGDTVYLDGAVVPTTELLRGLGPLVAAIDQAWAQATDPSRSPSYRDPNGLAALDQLSIGAWLDSVGATGAIRKLVEIAYTIEYGLEVGEQSALNLITLIGTETDKLALFGDSDERFHSALGSDAFTTRLAARLLADQLVLEHRLSRIEKQSDGRYRLDLDYPGGRREVVAERVVLTLPFSLLREVAIVGFQWPAAKSRAIAELGYGTSTKLMVGFAERAWRSLGAGGGSYSDTGYQASWETSRLQPGAGGILTNFTGGQHGLDIAEGSPDKQRDAFLKQLDPVFPGSAAASNGAVARYAWSTHPHSRGSYSAYRVGQWTAFAGAEGERVDNLFFAGEHTSQDAQGYMEGAALTGAMAALAIATELGLPAPEGLSLPARRIGERAQLALAEGSWIRALAPRARHS